MCMMVVMAGYGIRRCFRRGRRRKINVSLRPRPVGKNSFGWICAIRRRAPPYPGCYVARSLLLPSGRRNPRAHLEMASRGEIRVCVWVHDLQCARRGCENHIASFPASLGHRACVPHSFYDLASHIHLFRLWTRVIFARHIIIQCPL